MDKRFKKVKMKFLKGSLGNTEWWTDEDWENHRKHVAELKRTGEYLKEDYCYITFIPLPEFDDI